METTAKLVWWVADKKKASFRRKVIATGFDRLPPRITPTSGRRNPRGGCGFGCEVWV